MSSISPSPQGEVGQSHLSRSPDMSPELPGAGWGTARGARPGPASRPCSRLGRSLAGASARAPGGRAGAVWAPPIGRRSAGRPPGVQIDIPRRASLHVKSNVGLCRSCKLYTVAPALPTAPLCPGRWRLTR